MDDDIVIRFIRNVAFKTFIRAGIFIKFLWFRVLDVLGLFFNVIVLCTIIRIPGFLYIWKNIRPFQLTFMWKWRLIGLVHTLIFIVDIPFMLMAPFLLVFFWRAILVKRQHGPIKFDNDVGYEGWKLRKLIFKHFCLLWCDLFAIPLTLVIVFSWRCPTFLKKMRQETSEVGWKKIIFKEFCMVLLDAMTFPIFIVIFHTWRKSILVDKYYFYLLNNKHGHYRLRLGNRDDGYYPYANIQQNSTFYSILADIIEESGNNALKFKLMILKEFLVLCLDIATIPPLILIAISWRSPILYRLYLHLHTGLANPRRLTYHNEQIIKTKIWVHSLWLIIDIISLAPLAIVCFSWRLVFFIRGFKSTPLELKFITKDQWHGEPPHRSLMYNIEEMNVQIIENCYIRIHHKIWSEAVLFFTDIPYIIGFIIITLSSVLFPWRLLNVLDELVLMYHTGTMTQWRVRRGIFIQFFNLCRDGPAALMLLVIVVTGWRLPFLIENVLAINWNNKYQLSTKVIGVIWRQFTLLFVDVGVGALMVIIFCTLWRIYPFVRSVKKACVQKKEQEIAVTSAENDIAATASNPAERTTNENPITSGDNILTNETSRAFNNAFHGTDTPPSKTWKYFLSDYNGKRIRKSALLNVAFLLVDIPALILLLVNIAFVIRLPSIANKLINCGSFFIEFPLVMLQESGKLIVDLLHVVLGLFLLMVRPIAVVENLCEDENHRRLRELKRNVYVLKYYLKRREHYEENVESVLSILIKSYKHVSEDYAKLLFAQAFVEYSDSLSEIRQQLFDKELDETAIYYLSKLIFVQNKYPHYIARKFEIEKKYLMKPAVKARERNLKLYNEEFEAYRTVLSGLYKKIDEICIENAPLWSNKIGFLSRSRNQNHKVLKKTLTEGYFVDLILCFINVLFIYRAPAFLHLLYQEPFLIKRKALANLREYILDIKCLMKIVIVFLSIYRFPFLLSDLMIDIFCKQSISAIRQTVDTYPPQILKDVVRLLKLIFRWRSVAYIISSTLFFLLMPLSAVITLIRQMSSSKVIIYITSMSLYVLIFAIPLGFINFLQDVVPELAQESAANLFFWYFLILAVVLAFFILIRSKSSFVLPKIDYVRLNWSNIHVCLQEIIETGQIFALLFSIKSLTFPHADTLQGVFKYFLLDVTDAEWRKSLQDYLFIAWFLTCSVPVILEGVLEYVPKGTFSKHHFAWQSYLSLFGSTLFLCIPNMVVTNLACLNDIPGNAAMERENSTGLTCWSEPHADIAIKGVVCLVWYLITSILFCTKYINLENKMLDLRFSPIYSAAINLMKFILVIVIGFYKSYKMSSIINTIEILLMMIVFTLLMVFSGVKLCNSKLLLFWRLHSFCVGLFSACMMLALEYYDIKHPLIFYVIVGGVLTSYVILLLSSFYIRSYSDNEIARTEFIKTINEMLTVLDNNQNFIGDWEKIRRPWMRMIQVVRVANEADKDAEDHRDEVVIVDHSELFEQAPPSYEDVTNLETELPPSYDEVLNPIVPSETDEYFIPTVEYFTSPLGTWQVYDTFQIIEMYKWMTSEQVGIIATLTDKRCTGSELLLLLEQHIHYESLSYRCITHLDSWREVVRKSNWIGLEHCAKTLQQTISRRYEFPPVELAARCRANKSDLLPRNPDYSTFPELMDLSTVNEIKLKIHKREREKFMSFLPKPWKIIFSALIAEDFPMIHKFTIEPGTQWDHIICEMFTRVEIAIKNVKGTGFKIAQGAYIILPKTINITKINDDVCVFGQEYPCAVKGPFSKDLTLFKCVMRGDEMRIGIGDQARTCQINKVMDTLAELRWEALSNKD